jgi:hypothetical protein
MDKKNVRIGKRLLQQGVLSCFIDSLFFGEGYDKRHSSEFSNANCTASRIADRIGMQRGACKVRAISSAREGIWKNRRRAHRSNKSLTR